jgi:hypothetical protein
MGTDGAVPAFAEDSAVAHHQRADRHLAVLLGALRQQQGVAHVGLVAARIDADRLGSGWHGVVLLY